MPWLWLQALKHPAAVAGVYVHVRMALTLSATFHLMWNRKRQEIPRHVSPPLAGLERFRRGRWREGVWQMRRGGVADEEGRRERRSHACVEKGLLKALWQFRQHLLMEARRLVSPPDTYILHVHESTGCVCMYVCLCVCVCHMIAVWGHTFLSLCP